MKVVLAAVVSAVVTAAICLLLVKEGVVRPPDDQPPRLKATDDGGVRALRDDVFYMDKRYEAAFKAIDARLEKLALAIAEEHSRR